MDNEIRNTASLDATNNTKNSAPYNTTAMRNTAPSDTIKTINNDKRFGNASTDTIDRHAFDFEYSTQFKKEMMFLKERGFNPIFIKKTKDYRIPTYKYTKTPELFRAVAEFYEAYRNEKLYKKLDKIAHMGDVPEWVKTSLKNKDYYPMSQIMEENPVKEEVKNTAEAGKVFGTI